MYLSIYLYEKNAKNTYKIFSKKNLQLKFDFLETNFRMLKIKFQLQKKKLKFQMNKYYVNYIFIY